MNIRTNKGIEDTILNLFEELSYKHHWRNNEYCKNIHYYNGWKTNQSYFINKKVIIPLNAFDRYDSAFNPRYDVRRKLEDIQKCLTYLDKGIASEVDIENQLNFAEECGDTKDIQLKYFKVDFFKKGTTHITFTDSDILKRFNIFAGRSKNWLPPSYGKKAYKDMTNEEKNIINEFEGQQEYNKVISNPKYYIIQNTELLQIAN